MLLENNLDAKFMYESELRDLFEESLIELYGIKKDKLFDYITIRYMTYSKIKKVRDIDKQAFGRFILDELNITITDGKFSYKLTQISLNGIYEQSMESILNIFYYENEDKLVKDAHGSSLAWTDYVEKSVSQINKRCINKCMKFVLV